MNKGIIYYVIKNRIRSKQFLFFYIMGFVLFLIFFLFNKPFNDLSFYNFVNGIGMFLVFYYSMLAGLNGIGVDREKKYVEILYTKPMSQKNLIIVYYITYFFSALLPFIVFVWPSFFYLGKDFLIPSGFLFNQLTNLILLISYTTFFSVLFKGNYYIFVLLFLYSVSRLINGIYWITKISIFIFPTEITIRILLSIILLILSIIFENRRKTKV